MQLPLHTAGLHFQFYLPGLANNITDPHSTRCAAGQRHGAPLAGHRGDRPIVYCHLLGGPGANSSWGPGFAARVVMPACTFYLYAADMEDPHTHPHTHHTHTHTHAHTLLPGLLSSHTFASSMPVLIIAGAERRTTFGCPTRLHPYLRCHSSVSSQPDGSCLLLSHSSPDLQPACLPAPFRWTYRGCYGQQQQTRYAVLRAFNVGLRLFSQRGRRTSSALGWAHHSHTRRLRDGRACGIVDDGRAAPYTHRHAADSYVVDQAAAHSRQAGTCTRVNWDATPACPGRRSYTPVGTPLPYHPACRTTVSAVLDMAGEGCDLVTDIEPPPPRILHPRRGAPGPAWRKEAFLILCDHFGRGFNIAAHSSARATGVSLSLLLLHGDRHHTRSALPSPSAHCARYRYTACAYTSRTLPRRALPLRLRRATRTCTRYLPALFAHTHHLHITRWPRRHERWATPTTAMLLPARISRGTALPTFYLPATQA